jgi:hypothetical protein
MMQIPTNSSLAIPLRLLAVLWAAMGLTAVHAADTAYQQVENWAQLPDGTKWAMMTAVDIDSHGTVYVYQRGVPAQVMAFDSSGKLLRSWSYGGGFPSAHGLRVDRDDNVWVTDRGWHQVLKFSPEGKLLLALGRKGVMGDNNSTDALNGPSDVAFGPNGEIFVSDGESTNTRVVKFTAEGKFIKFWGTKGSGPGQLDVPHAIAIDSKRRLYVADRSNKRIEIFDQEGGYLGVMTNAGTPYGLFIAKGDILYACDGSQGKNDVTVVDLKDQRVLAHFGGLTGPHMLSVDASGSIYVAETTGAAVKKFVRN